MERSLMQVYVKDSDKAVAFYQKVFDAKLVSGYPDEGGRYYHAELDVYGQILAVAECCYGNYGEAEGTVGNTMQFCLHFGEGTEELVRKIAGDLQEGAKVLYPLGPTSHSPLLTDLIDQFGVRWCIFV